MRGWAYVFFYFRSTDSAAGGSVATGVGRIGDIASVEGTDDDVVLCLDTAAGNTGLCVLTAILTGAVSALIFSLFSQKLDLNLLKKLFGGLLIAAGLREIFYKPKEKREGQ